MRIERDAVYGPERDYPAQLWERVRSLLPVPVKGLRVLDVGCNGGFFSVALKRLGAAAVTGVESHPAYLEQTRLVREALGIDLDLRGMSIYELSPASVGRFDLVLCLGVVYHLRHPLLGLEALASVTRGHVVLEAAIVPGAANPTARDWLRRLGRSGPDTRYGGPAHVVHFIENGPGPEGLQNWFVPTLPALCAMMKAAGFREIVGARDFGARGVVVARTVAS